MSLILIMTLSKQEKDMALVLTMAVCCGVCVAALRFLEPVIAFLMGLEDLAALQGGMLGILLKITLIGLVGEICGLLCQDSGCASLGKAMQFLSTALILSQSLPVFEAMLELIQMILGEL